MADVFVSYARPDEPHAKRVADALHAAGYNVWRDEDLPAHRPYAEVIEERLKSAKAVVVLWSAEAAKSQWVRSEANAARELGTLIQVRLDTSIPPMPFDQIQCADLCDWESGGETPGWRKLTASVEALAGTPNATKGGSPRAAEVSVCVLPFQNMSGDADQEYFSDGISEDITTDLSKVSSLAVTARNTAFMFKGQAVDVCDVARKLGVSHVLEGSVRKSGERVRITAQLIDGQTGAHVWAERFDRELTDIFAIQDEISEAIVAALKLKLLPEEKRAIENRGTTSAEAYDFYLMAREYWVSGNDGDPRRDQIILRLCQKAVDIDPTYARAWSLMAITQAWMHHRGNTEIETGVMAADRALELDPRLAEPHCVKASDLAQQGRFEEANAEIATALRLDPESWDVNKEAAFINYRQGRLSDAVNQFEKAAALMDSDYRSAGMMASCARGLGETEKLHKAAQMTLERAERALREDRNNGAALAYGAVALGELGEVERAREWVRRALVVDPDNRIMRFNLACLSTASLNDNDAALELIAPFMEHCGALQVTHVQNDPDLANLRPDPRFQAMIADAKARLGLDSAPDASPAEASARPHS